MHHCVYNCRRQSASGIRVLSVKVQGATGTGRKSIIAGLRWLLKNALRLKVRVVNMSYGATTTTNAAFYPPEFLDKAGKLKPGISAKRIAATEECAAIAALSRMGVTVVVSAGNNAQPTADRPYCWCAAAISVSWASDFDGLQGGLVPGPLPVYGDDILPLGFDDAPYFLSGYAVAGTAASRRMVAALEVR